MTAMRFGYFMAPFHPVGQNPTLALERDLDGLLESIVAGSRLNAVAGHTTHIGLIATASTT